MERKIGVSPSNSSRADSGAGTMDDDLLLQLETIAATHEQIVRRRRWSLAAAAGLILITGLVVNYATVGAVGDFVGDAFYAVLVFLLLSFVFVRQNSWRIAVVAILFCTAIELFQLTGLPVSFAEAFPPARFVFGTTFSFVDLIAYIGGVLAAAAVSTWRRLD